jgi:hypothetical protein
MNNTIINLMDKPMRVNKDSWLFDNIGRISAALSTDSPDTADIIAYSDEKKDIAEVEQIARENNGFTIHNISERGVSYID